MKETRCDPKFERLLAGFYRQPLDQGDDVIYGVWPDLTLAYSNARWARFAVENDGADVLRRWTIGTSVRSAFGPELDPFYVRAFADVLATGTIWQHVYTCPSPRQMRWFNMRALPLGREGLLVCHSLVSAAEVVKPRGGRPSAAPYRNTNGMVTQCSHCRRVKVAATHLALPVAPASSTLSANSAASAASAASAGSDWHHVPAFIKRAPQRTTHGLCPLCFVYHFKGMLTPDQLRGLGGTERRARAPPKRRRMRGAANRRRLFGPAVPARRSVGLVALLHHEDLRRPTDEQAIHRQGQSDRQPVHAAGRGAARLPRR
jgi:hypothetical protein